MSESTTELLISPKSERSLAGSYPRATPGAAEHMSCGFTPRHELRVLVVDGEAESADRLARMIGVWGHDARWVCDSAAALPLAIAHQAETVILDVGLSDMTAYTLARMLRGEPRLKGCLLLALRWHSDRRRDAQSRLADIDIILAKPVDLLVLETLLALEGDRLAS